MVVLIEIHMADRALAKSRVGSAEQQSLRRATVDRTARHVPHRGGRHVAHRRRQVLHVEREEKRASSQRGIDANDIHVTGIPISPQFLQPLDRFACAREVGLDPAQMALAFVNSRDFVTANIIGATSMEQLRTDIASIDVKLTPEIEAKIDAIHQLVGNPCP